MSAFDVQSRTLISRTQLNRPIAKRVYWVVLILAIVLFAVVFLFPLYWVATSGLKSASEVLQSPPTLVPHHVDFGNYATAWSDFNLGRFIFNTAYYAVGAL